MTPVQESAVVLAGVLGRRVRETPIAVLDFETTGMRAGVDRVVEAAVVRVDPGEKPRLVFDSLINPGRPMACTEVHGIRAEDVASAPTFAEIAGAFAAAIEGCVVAAYNVAFDARFLSFELANAGCRHRPPLLCLMFLRPLLGLGVRCRLEYACRLHRIEHDSMHVAAGDAFAAAMLVEPCLSAMDRRGISTYSDLSKLGRYRFLESFICSPLADPTRFGLQGGRPLVSRAVNEPTATDRRRDFDYWSELQIVGNAANLSGAELSRIRTEWAARGLKAEQIRGMHARLFADVLRSLVDNGRLDMDGARQLQRLRERLSALGWAPGD